MQLGRYPGRREGLTHDEVELGVSLECIVQGNEEGKVPDCLED